MDPLEHRGEPRAPEATYRKPCESPVAVGGSSTDAPDRAVVGQGMKRSRLLLVVILIAVATLVGSLWVDEGPLWR